MKHPARKVIVAAAVLAATAVAVPVIATDASSTDPASSPNSTAAQAVVAAEPSLFVPIEHFRAADTRDPESPNAGKLVVGGDGSKIIDVARRDGDPFETREIPPEATAVSFNVTVAQTEGRGFIHIDSPIPPVTGESSTVNWTEDGQTVSNGGVTIVGTTDAEQVLLALARIGGEPGAAAHIVVDVTGYYIPPTAP